jgi:hypothetical protein
MLKDLIKRLREEGRWGIIEDTFIAMKDEILGEMRSGQIKTQTDLEIANAKLELLDRCVNLEHFKGR